MKDVNVLLVSPIITEKASDQKAGKKYSFRVVRDANKIEIKKAVESIYKVEVEKVNIVNMKPKWKRVRLQYGLTDMWKKAIVTLKNGEIDFYKV
jgi:large subunit ribosomal protein L23